MSVSEVKLFSPRAGTMPKKPRIGKSTRIWLNPEDLIALKIKAKKRRIPVSKLLRIIIKLELEDDISEIELGKTKATIIARKQVNFMMELDRAKARIKELEKEKEQKERKPVQRFHIPAVMSMIEELEPLRHSDNQFERAKAQIGIPILQRLLE